MPRRGATVAALWFACLGAHAAEPAVDPLETFESRLRDALDAGTVEAMLPLVQLPLRVNGEAGETFALDNEAALARRYAEVFTPAWQAQVRAADARGRIRRNGDLGIAGGVAWLREFGSGTAGDLRLVVVNLPERREPAAREIAFACGTGAAFFRIERDGEAFHVFATPRGGAEQRIETVAPEGGGTGPCYARAWRFAWQERVYLIEEPGCRQDVPPERARATVESSGEGPPRSAWCY